MDHTSMSCWSEMSSGATIAPLVHTLMNTLRPVASSRVLAHRPASTRQRYSGVDVDYFSVRIIIIIIIIIIYEA